jgi:hypothetical protein
MVIPIGLELSKTGLVTFSADVIEMPAGYKAILEDRQLGVFTDLKTGGSKYEVILPASTKGTGRFYLHTLSSSATKISAELKKITTFAVGKEVYIKGLVSENSNAIIYDLYGRKLKTVVLDPTDFNTFRVDDLLNGIYIIKVVDKEVQISEKIFLE